MSRRSWTIALGAVLCLSASSSGQGDLKAPPGFKAKPGTALERYSHTGWAQEIVHEKTGIEMVFIPAGEFMMGSPAGERGKEDESPVHRVRITKPFYMGKYEVTQGEWEKLMGDNPSQFKGSDRLPVERVTWKDCEEYARKAGDGLALPTEAEWEHACRAGTRTRFHYGDDDDELGEYAWFESNSGSRTHDVGQKSPNAWGLYDMHGNVQEWCRDWYGGKYYAESPGNDPTGPKEGVHRVLRGGCWSGLRWHCRSAIRTWYAPGVRYGLIGLRLSLDPK